MSRVRNIKIDFSGKNYDSSSLFEVGANGGVPSTSSVTYAELSDTGAGYNMTIAEETNLISVTASNGDCVGTINTSSFNSYPFPSTSPIRLSSTAYWGPKEYGITFAGSQNCNDVYICSGTGSDEVYRLHNITGEFYNNRGPFDAVTGSFYSPYRTELLYLPEYDAIAYAQNRYKAGVPFLYNYSPFNIISMSGELLYATDFSGSYDLFPLEDIEHLRQVGKYLYGRGATAGSGSTEVNGPFVWRIDLTTMTFDNDWCDTVARGVTGTIVSDYIVTSGSDELIAWYNDTVNHVAADGTLRARLQTDGGRINGCRLPDGSYNVTGDWSALRYITSSVGVLTPFYTQYQLMRVDEYLDFRPYTASYSRYTNNIYDSANVEWQLLNESGSYIILGGNGGNIFNSNVSGSYTFQSGALAYIDFTGSMIPFNYPTGSYGGNNVSKIFYQEDGSYITIFDTAADYDGKDVEYIMFQDINGQVTDYL